MANWCESKDVLREIREKAYDSLKNCHAKPLQIIQISEHKPRLPSEDSRGDNTQSFAGTAGTQGSMGRAEWHFQGAARFALARIQAQISSAQVCLSHCGNWQCGIRNLPNPKQAGDNGVGNAASLWGVRYSGERTWDSVNSLPGMSFIVQKIQQRLETLVIKAENTFVSVLYQTDMRKDKQESGLVWGHWDKPLWTQLPFLGVCTTEVLLTASRRHLLCVRKLLCNF